MVPALLVPLTVDVRNGERAACMPHNAVQIPDEFTKPAL
jgi:hypothetical protein